MKALMIICMPRTLITLFLSATILACSNPMGSPPKPSPTYDWKAEVTAYYDSLNTAREYERKLQEQQVGLYSTLILMNATTSSVIIRADVVDNGFEDKDLLLGGRLNPGQSLVRIFEGELPRTIKLLWTDNVATMHNVPRDGRMIIGQTESGYQGTNIFIMN